MVGETTIGICRADVGLALEKRVVTKYIILAADFAALCRQREQLEHGLAADQRLYTETCGKNGAWRARTTRADQQNAYPRHFA